MRWLNKWRTRLLAVMLCASSAANALTVYDPWNHIENINQLAQQVQQVQQAIQLVQQGGQMLNLANLNQMSWIIDLVGVHQQQGTLTSLQSALSSFYQQAGGASGALQGIWRQYQYSSVPTWNEYLEREQRIAEANHGVHTAAFQHASETLQGLEQQHRTIQDLSARTDTSVGTMQLMQTLNKHMNLIAQQNTQILGLLAQQRQEESDEKSQEDEIRKKGPEAARKLDAGTRKSWSDFLEQLKPSE